MSDIPDSGSFNLGLANIASQNYGPTAVANQGLTGAQTQEVQQAAKGQQIKNANDMLQLQAMRYGMSMLYRTPGAAVGDQSGVDSATPATAAAPRAAATAPSSGGASATVPSSSGGTAPAPVGSPSANAAAAPGAPVDQTDEDIGESVAHPELLDNRLRGEYQINPLGTPDEQNNVMRMSMISTLTKNPGYANTAVMQRDMAVGQRRFLAQQDASRHYDVMTAVADAGDDGKAWDVLNQVAPDSAKKISQLHPDATPAELNTIAADTAAHYAARIHQYTGREVEQRKDGTYIDAATKNPVPGVGGTKLAPDEYSKAIDAANAPVDIKNSDGTSTQMPVWKYAKSQGMPVSSAADYVKQKADAQQAIAQHKQQVQDRFTAQQTQQQVAQGIPPQPGAQPGAAGQPSPQQNTAQPGQQPGAQSGAVPQPGAAPQSGAQPQRPDNGLLPGVNPDALPKIQAATSRLGVSQSPAEAEMAKGIVTERLAQMKDANTNFVETQKEGALIRAAQRQAATLANDPRMVGPGSEVAQGLAKLQSFVSGQPPDALVNLGALDKILLQMGAQNIRQALSGQRITNQEFMTLMTKGNPNTEQPLATVNKLLGYLGAQNDYESRFQRTKQIALQRGANPMTVDADIGAQSDRGDYVESRVGVRPPTNSGAQAATAPQNSGGIAEGAVSTSKSGKPIVYANGHWQYK